MGRDRRSGFPRFERVHTFQYQPEYDMKSGETRSMKKLVSGSCIAFLALSLTFGVSAVRADSETPAPSLHEMLLNPIMDVVHAVEARLARLETTAASFAGSFNSRQITSQELCIADQTGAQTCLT